MILVIFFFIVALLYSIVGFGGGSSYNAILVLAKTNYQLIPIISLSCNIIVVTGGTCYFFKKKNISFKPVIPWVITSVPAAFLGGLINLPKTVFIGILGTVLLISGLRMIIPYKNKENTMPIFWQQKKKLWTIAPILGSILGLVAGLTGIGGGIFLSPVLYWLRFGSIKNIAGICSVFILFNSTAALISQIIKLHQLDILSKINNYWPLFLAVFLGGQIGSWLGSSKLKKSKVALITGILITYVAVNLLIKWWLLMISV